MCFAWVRMEICVKSVLNIHLIYSNEYTLSHTCHKGNHLINGAAQCDSAVIPATVDIASAIVGNRSNGPIL